MHKDAPVVPGDCALATPGDASLAISGTAVPMFSDGYLHAVPGKGLLDVREFFPATLGDDCLALRRDTAPESSGDIAQWIPDHAAPNRTRPLPRNKVCPEGTTSETFGERASANSRR